MYGCVINGLRNSYNKNTYYPAALARIILLISDALAVLRDR